MPKTRAHVFVDGEVQGRGFRSFIERHALRLSVTGWVRNLEDGRVEAVFEGDKELIDQLLNLVREGPPFARVKAFDTVWEKPTSDFSTFVVTP